jgi:hypothetical protein
MVSQRAYLAGSNPRWSDNRRSPRLYIHTSRNVQEQASRWVSGMRQSSSSGLSRHEIATEMASPAVPRTPTHDPHARSRRRLLTHEWHGNESILGRIVSSGCGCIRRLIGIVHLHRLRRRRVVEKLLLVVEHRS